MDALLRYYFQKGFFVQKYVVVFIKVSRHRNVYVKSSAAIAVEGDRGAGARENRGREGYGRREK